MVPPSVHGPNTLNLSVDDVERVQWPPRPCTVRAWQRNLGEAAATTLHTKFVQKSLPNRLPLYPDDASCVSNAN